MSLLQDSFSSHDQERAASAATIPKVVQVLPFVFFNSVLAHMLKFTQLQKPIQIKECVIQSCIISFGTTNKVQIKSLTLMVIFSQWKVKKVLKSSLSS